MRLTYQYKLRPTLEQAATMENWLDMLRAQYNWMLADRFEWWQFNRCSINACSLVQGPGRLRHNPDYYSQKKSLPGLKKQRPWYKEIHSQVLQRDRCGLFLNRDHNAAINIKQRGVGHQPLNLSDHVLAVAGSL